MNERKGRADRLYDAIGMIDERLIADASSPKRARELIKARRRTHTALIAAACLFCIVIGTMLKLPDIYSNKSPGTSTKQPSAPQNDLMTLEEALVQANGTRLSFDEIDLFGGEAKLIWQFEGEDDYYVKELEKSNLSAIKKKMEQTGEELSPEKSQAVTVKVWIAYGDGRVVSPYLKNAPGNTGYGKLFDYSAEIEPGEALTKTVYELTK